MYGRSFTTDQAFPTLDPRTRFGAQSQYGDPVAAPWRLSPQNLLPQGHAPSEHNIGNIPVRFVVAQLAGQTFPPNLQNLISYRTYLGPGNQSLAST